MKTETRIYDDGTEPDVVRRSCCDGLCNQGRACPEAPAPAEACTEIGVDDGPEALGSVVLMGVVIVAVVGVIALLAGYYA